MRKVAYLTLIPVIVTSIYFFLPGKIKNSKKIDIEKQFSQINKEEESGKEEAGYKRWLYEWKMLHDPATGEIPRDIHLKESALLSSIIQKQKAAGFRIEVNNTYLAAGPTQNGGRTRALAFDMRNNQIVLAGGVSGGMFRSTNGGNSWTFVSPSNDVRNISCIAQDPRPGFQDIWYAGTGELLGPSPQYPNAFIPGYGIYKSTDNGASWTKIPSTITFNIKEDFDNITDIVFNIQVDPNGNVFAAILNYILRSTDGGTTWGIAIHETGELANSNQNIYNMITDIAISKPGVSPTRYYASFSGRNRDRDTAGVWTSTTGARFSWTRIAGGRFGNADSVAGWKPYNNSTDLSGNYTNGWGKTSLAIAPSNPNILYVMYQNAQSAANNQPEADLFKADLTSFPSITWSNNRSANLQATRTTLPPSSTSSTKYMELQDGYNMLLAVHPTNQNLVIAGGVNLFRSTDGFATQGTFIGGLTSTTFTDPNQFSHVDFHSFSFDPSNANRFAVGDDGGLQVTNDITATSVSWNNFASQYQTFQYYHVAIDPTAGSLTFSGGAQDNSTTYRDSKALLDAALPDPNDHYVGLIGGDGGMTALTPSTSTSHYLFGSFQEGNVYRLFVNGTSSSISPSSIAPAAAGDGEFVTYFHVDPDNTDLMYYVSLDSIWRTTSSTSVSASTGWTLMTGIASTLTGSIFSLATTRGNYSTSNGYLFIGTSNGKIYRLQNPRDAAASTAPVDISPSSGLGMTSQSLVREIAVNPRNPDTALAVISNYGVASAFWSGNATSASPTWQLVEGNIALASFRSCAIVATNSGVEYYIGTSIGLFSTLAINGNSTIWTLEGSPVMQGALVNDLALRTADNTLLIGTHGNGMFYTNIGNIPTAITDIIRNDKKFIATVFPTVSNQVINFQTGGATGIKTMNVKVYNMKGQTVLQKIQSYQNGSVSIGQLPSGSYVLEIMSDNRKFRHVQQIVKSQ
jgi:hypothetical protein